jgi:MscS family membrane protein
MSAFLDYVIYGNPVRDWLIALAIFALSPMVAKAGYWLFANVIKKLTEKTETNLDDIIVEALEAPLLKLLLVLGIWSGLIFLELPTRVDAITRDIVDFLFTMLIAWFLVRLLDGLIDEYIKPLVEASDNDLDDQLLPILQKVCKVLIWGFAVIMSMKHAGYDVGALLAGLGIGGVALAMAAKDTIANMFGGFTILADRPFRMNDRIKVVGYDGHVGEIGLRSTRLKTLEGRTVTIPNSKFSESPVENISWEPSRKVTVELGLTYDTTPQQMEQAMELLRRIARQQAGIEEKTVLYFSAFAASSLNITFTYFIRKGADVIAVQNDMNMAILRQFNEAGLAFAFPTQTVYTIPSGR